MEQPAKAADPLGAMTFTSQGLHDVEHCFLGAPSVAPVDESADNDAEGRRNIGRA
jgi:hypothetical protein